MKRTKCTVILCLCGCFILIGCLLFFIGLNDPSNLYSNKSSNEMSVFPPPTETFIDKPEQNANPLQHSPSAVTSRYTICIDPGHFGGVNKAECDDSYGYVEGNFTLQLALCLKEILEERYGVEVFLTRETDNITIGDFSNEDLDNHNIALRGSYAKEHNCDFFISLHTNANLPNANGYETYSQPIDITKVIILANVPCCKSEQWLAVANQIGLNLTRKNFELGIATHDEFIPASVGKVPTWTDEWNDSLTQLGAVLCRLNGDEDHYGVLRGSASVGVPGIIIEHGFHTVPYMRYLAANENLAEIWAEVDALAIAEALGLPTNT